MSGAHDFKLWRAKTMCVDRIWMPMGSTESTCYFGVSGVNCRALRLLLFFATQDDLGWLLTWIWVTNDLKLDSCGTLMIVIVSLHVSTSLNKAQDGPRFTNNWPILTKCDCVSVSVCGCVRVCVCLPKASSVQRLQSSFLCRPLFSNSQIEISVGVQTVQGSCKSHASSSPSDQPDSANAVSHNWWYYTYWYVDV